MTADSNNFGYVISLDKVREIALSGITRASRFAKFAAMGNYEIEKVNECRPNGGIVSYDTIPPITDGDFTEWQNAYISWSINNAVNEVVESFLTFLEYVYVALDQHGTRIPVKTGDKINQKIKEEQNRIRSELRSKNKLKALTEKGISISDNESRIIESFAEIRNLLSHNLGIADERKKLQLIEGKILLEWYQPELFVKLNSGEEIKFENEPIYCEEGGTVCMRPKAIQQKTIDIGHPISFTVTEIYQIVWTFWLLVHDINAKVLAVLNPAVENIEEAVPN